ncbi:MAG: UDP-N-acetylmuramoyl-L-alanyl-D-glutamate--2,6-diaminopimelate ligase [Bacteroidetes bacterium]|nr:MAG: UDP-N-acetylmuramoyl-L-alanyl-D-glutamate--2,6-diaminopimelate ligase [Bacteroidota bacterium]
MKILQEIIYKVPLLAVKGNTSIEIRQIQFDSRKIQQNDVFVAIKGEKSDGHEFIESVSEKGILAVVCEILPQNLKEGITYLQVRNSSEALAIMACNFYDRPSEKLKLVGITGTNGKTTTVTLLHALFMRLGYHVGLLSTIQHQIGNQVFSASHTTPDALTINELLKKIVDAGCTHAFMEVSSHALVQHRVTGLDFDGAIFSNLTHDHLDYHQTFEAYRDAKKLFFDRLNSKSFALVNRDDKNGEIMLQNCKAKKHFYGIKSMADFKAKIVSNSPQGIELEIGHQQIWFQLIGEFNAYNLLTVYASAVLLGEDSLEILAALSALNPVKGRFERIMSKQNILAIVDYSHTPDSLQNVLKTIDHFRTRNEQVITVVGCGGNRDASKRPMMADIACKYSNKVILTSDNPRFEEPEQIIEQMQKGVQPIDFKKTMQIVDRAQAIQKACEIANSGDIILIAGKGHEDYQEIKGEKHHFDDREMVEKMFALLDK